MKNRYGYGEFKKELPLTIIERGIKHQERHPNDKNIRREGKGVTWSKITERDKRLQQFYKEHIHTFVDENDLSKRAWVRVSGFKGDEE
tara:strand:- start:5145 stop:5408 length:264 start_codon:yes stop_codon:yes gene_type:complete